ncbi:DNA-binding protein [Companilactobacillus sp. RD055328]|uniref:RNase P modulator RnpM n=1 Tax=Companilactobacillus sp. RD055328 TaxID=2916634 RepID=UPI001FC83F5B|nr:YlxR family protein [Companilactobacillus sp. RD055328]GKQ42613.1 DNA-binding protein [Companilactobacillus sp. RD055328]
MVKQRKVPMRKDLLTNEMFPKKQMVRIVKNKEGQIAIDPTGKMPGRGAYVGLDPQAVKKAKDKNTIEKAFQVAVAPEFYDELFDYVDHQQARMELFGDIGKKH